MHGRLLLDCSKKNQPAQMPITAVGEILMGSTGGKKEQGEGASCQIWKFREVSEEVAFELSLLGGGRSASSIKGGRGF